MFCKYWGFATLWLNRPRDYLSGHDTDQMSIVVYFDQQTGAPHPVRWSKSFASALKQVLLSFSVTNKRKKKKKGKCSELVEYTRS